MSTAKEEFFDASQLRNKNRSNTFHGMMHLFHSYIEIYTVKYRANDSEITLFVQSEPLMVVPHSVNLSMYEITVFIA